LNFGTKIERLLVANLRAWDALVEFSGDLWRSQGHPQGSKNVILHCKINDFDENDVDAKNDVFVHFWDPYERPRPPLERETTPCNFPKSSPERPSGATGPQKTSFYYVFLMFFVGGSKFNQI